MYDILKLENFKCFRNQRIPLANLTVLVGANGAGKSSVVQSMLLLRQVIESPKIEMVQLNGPYGLALGLDGSIENQSISNGRTKLSIQSGKELIKAHKFYERNGWKKEEVNPGIYLRDGAELYKKEIDLEI